MNQPNLWKGMRGGAVCAAAIGLSGLVLPGAGTALAETLAPANAAAPAPEKEAEFEFTPETLKKVEELPEELREEFLTFARKVAASRKVRLRPAMEKEVAKLVEQGSMDAAAQASLRALADQAYRQSGQFAAQAVALQYVPGLVRNQMGALALKSWSAEAFATNPGLTLGPPPEETEVWKKGLEGILKPDHLATLAREAKEKRDKVLADLEDELEATATGMAESYDRQMNDALGRILRYVELDEERTKQLRAASASACAEAVQIWRTNTVDALLKMGEADRKRLTQRGRGNLGFVNTVEGDLPEARPAWTSALETVLTAADREKIGNGERAFREHRAMALAKVLLGEMDPFIGLAGNQREGVTGLMAKQLSGLPKPFFINQGQGYSYMDPGAMLEKIKLITAEDLGKFLSPEQTQRFLKVQAGELLNSNSYGRASNMEQLEDQLPVVHTQPEVERVLSLILARESVRLRQSYLDYMNSRLEVVGRTVALSPEAIRELTSAARGAGVAMAQDAVGSLAQHVQQQLRAAPPGEWHSKMKNLNVPISMGRGVPVEPVLWTHTLNRVLTPEQRELWKKELEARRTWQEDALSGLVATEVAKGFDLTPEKYRLLEEELGKSIRKYGEDISNMMGTGWYLQGYYNTVPVALIPKKQLEKIFTPQQWEKWTTEGALGGGEQYAEMIRTRHRSRNNGN